MGDMLKVFSCSFSTESKTKVVFGQIISSCEFFEQSCDYLSTSGIHLQGQVSILYSTAVFPSNWTYSTYSLVYLF